jgi:hypothetical protein
MNAVSSEKLSKASILFHDSIAFPCSGREALLQTKHLLLQGLDVHLLSLTVRTIIPVSIVPTVTIASVLPLSLAVELLTPCECGLAVWLRASSFGCLAICRYYQLLIFEVVI